MDSKETKNLIRNNRDYSRLSKELFYLPPSISSLFEVFSLEKSNCPADSSLACCLTSLVSCVF